MSGVLSQYFPAWLIPTLSPLFNFIRSAIPEAWRGTAMLAVCFLATVGVVVATPLTGAEIATQAVVLFGIVTAGYTITKPMEGQPKLGVAMLGGSLLLIGIGVGLDTAWAQEEIPGVVQQTASFWLQVGMGFLNGVLGRLVKKIKA